ncbi:uncharacterized protein LOC113471642 [Diaphorina citri]|uniref:Phenylalanine--tRNA ligase alpha subunit n=1 Tax=Diaphorina citri TaxID=121845 RepID=A0A3Q0JJ01_DIACI|nr:phenylalanine--tRNA ligase subunit alpha [Candidatus Profftella armatura]XP_026686745.1 uncharacterized protein LOC113471642 [Diaphorina citri]QLK13683.1 phenylalanine--tRNA ligase subunit alpha [Candidatus Profftella armatura]
MNELKKLLIQAKIDFSTAVSISSLENAKSYYLGKNGKLTQYIKNIKNISINERKRYGEIINSIKINIKKELNIHRDILKKKQLKVSLKTNKIDITLPGRGKNKGGLHPIMRTLERIEKIFYSIGFDITDGPEIETDFNNFTALNSPKNHPARSMHDTFYIKNRYVSNNKPLLRTHTSPMQIRYSKINKPPIKVITSGRVYRIDSDSTHSPMFHQIEGLWIDKNISFSDLKGVYLNFIRVFFESDNIQIRFRPSYFPFTEPSAEIDIVFQDGPLKGNWLEISGAGQVNPKVLCNMNLDPEKYIGFAFGSGLERLTMLRYGIDDLRLFYKGNINFLKQFT